MKFRIDRILFLLTTLILLSNPILANDVTISGIEIVKIEDNFAKVKFSISWDNSWRETGNSANWDAVWIFLKVSKDNADGYSHLYPEYQGHTFPSTAEIVPGLIDVSKEYDSEENPVVGVFIQRSQTNTGSGDVSFSDVELLVDLGNNNLVDMDFEISIHAVEMIYVPGGDFYAGSSGEEEGRFIAGGTTDEPFHITSGWDKAISNETGGIWGSSTEGTGKIGGVGELDSKYPTGVDAFYIMKYEVSQDQYTAFLNGLSYTGQNSRTASVPDSETGTQAMTDSVNTNRNGITISSPGEDSGIPAVYETSSPFLAANHLSWTDGAAYLDWSGLRPITELEFEKAAKEPTDQTSNQFVWGTENIASIGYAVTNLGMTSESVTNAAEDGTTGNALYESTSEGIEGPVRVGIFANGSSSRAQSGAGFWGVMELSGNLREQVVNISTTEGRQFTGLHGSGEISETGDADVLNWPGSDGVGAGTRGGGFSDAVTILRTADRTFSSEAIETRLANTGMRGGRSVSISGKATLSFIIIDDDSTRKETDSTVVQSDPSGIDCRRIGLETTGICSAEFEPGTDVSLIFSSNIDDVEFQVDNGELVSVEVPLGVKLTESVSVEGRVLNGNDPVELTMEIWGNGFEEYVGSVNSIPEGINCSSNTMGGAIDVFPQCVLAVPRNTVVTLEGEVAELYKFEAYFNKDAELLGNEISTSFTLEANTQVNAFFRSTEIFPLITDWRPIELNGPATPITGDIDDTDSYLVGGYIMLGPSGRFENRTMLYRNDDLSRIVALPEVITGRDVHGISINQETEVISVASQMGLYECSLDPDTECQFVPLNSENPDEIINIKDVIHSPEGRILLQAGDQFNVWRENETGWESEEVPFSTSGFTNGRLFYSDDDHVIIQGSRALLDFNGDDWSFINIANINLSGIVGTNSDNLFMPFSLGGVVGVYKWDGNTPQIVYRSDTDPEVGFSNENPSIMMAETTDGSDTICGSEGDKFVIALTGAALDTDEENNGFIGISCDNGDTWNATETEFRSILSELRHTASDGFNVTLTSPVVKEVEEGAGSEITEQKGTVTDEYSSVGGGGELIRFFEYVIDGIPGSGEVGEIAYEEGDEEQAEKAINTARNSDNMLDNQTEHTSAGTLFGTTINGISIQYSDTESAAQIPINDLNGDPHQLSEVFPVSGKEAYAVTDSPIRFHGSNLIAGLILQFKDSVWSEMPNPAKDSETLLYAIEGSGPEDIYAVGEMGTILHYDGMNWDTIDAGLYGTEELTTIWSGGESLVLIGGHRSNVPVLLHYNGSIWTDFEIPSSIDLDVDPITDIWGTGFGNIWIVAENGHLANWNGSSWTEYTNVLDDLEVEFYPEALRLAGNGPNDVYLLAPPNSFGDKSTVFHFDGENWASIYEADDPDLFLWDIAAGSDGKIFVSGTLATILEGIRE